MRNQFNHLAYSMVDASAAPATPAARAVPAAPKNHVYSEELTEVLAVLEKIPTYPTPNESLVNISACCALGLPLGFAKINGCC